MTGRLRLRPWKKGDGRFLMNWLVQERQMRMWCRDHFAYPLTWEQLIRYGEEMEKDEEAFGFTALDESGTPVGSFRISRVDYRAKSIHLGFIVIDPDRRGQGLGNEMVTLAVKYGVDFLGMKRITLNVFDSNPCARRCYEKTGFKEESFREKDYAFREEIWGNSLMAYTSKG
ncbi:GNAT family protein [Lachnospiraceae bacterium 54-53]